MNQIPLQPGRELKSKSLRDQALQIASAMTEEAFLYSLKPNFHCLYLNRDGTASWHETHDLEAQRTDLRGDLLKILTVGIGDFLDGNRLTSQQAKLHADFLSEDLNAALKTIPIGYFDDET
jgi:hypothetical protein